MYKDFIKFNQSISSPEYPIDFQQLVYSPNNTYKFLTSNLTFTGYPYTIEIDFFYLDDNRKIHKLKGIAIKRIDLSSPIEFTEQFPGPHIGYRIRLTGGLNPTVSGAILYTPVGVNND